jgi:protein gp37
VRPILASEHLEAALDRLERDPAIALKQFARRLFSRTVYVTVTPNAWLGTSVEDCEYGLPRITVLQRIQSSIRFLSIEPLLEDIGALNLAGIAWVIVGGESGPHARPMKAEWARSIRDQCSRAGVAFFFKQWGAYGNDGVRRAKSANGRQLDGRMYERMPA